MKSQYKPVIILLGIMLLSIVVSVITTVIYRSLVSGKQSQDSTVLIPEPKYLTVTPKLVKTNRPDAQQLPDDQRKRLILHCDNLWSQHAKQDIRREIYIAICVETLITTPPESQ